MKQKSPFSNFLLLGFLRSLKKPSIVRLIYLFSLLMMTLGFCALITIASLMNNYHQAFYQAIFGFNAHVLITPLGESSFDSADQKNIQEYLKKQKEVVFFRSYQSQDVLLVLDHKIQIAFAKMTQSFGDTNQDTLDYYDLTGSKKSLDQLFIKKPKGLVLGKVLFDQWQKTKLKNQESSLHIIRNRNQFRPEALEVTGYFQSGVDQFDRHFILASHHLNSLWQKEFLSGGFEVFLVNRDYTPSFIADLEDQLPETNVISWYQVNKSLFETLQVERMVSKVILALALGIILMQVLGCLSLILLFRKDDWILLKVLGTTRNLILRVIMKISLFTVLVSFGLASGLTKLAFWLFDRYELIPIDSQVYQVTMLTWQWPFEFWWVVLASCVVLALLLGLIVGYSFIRSLRGPVKVHT